MANGGYTLDGVKIDVVHATVDAVGRILGDVVDRLDSTLWKHEVLSTLQTAIPLVGRDVVTAWQARAVNLRVLAAVMIRRHLRFGPRAFLETLATRADFLLLRELLARIERQTSGILLALYRVFTPSASGKWAPRAIDSLTCLPVDILEGARRVWFLPESTAIAAAHALIEAALALVGERCPEIYVRRARARIAARSVDG